MGWFGDLWTKIKRPFASIYDNVIKPAANWISNTYDKVKTFLPAPIRAPLDAIQNTGKAIGDNIQTARNVMTTVGLKDGGEVLKDKMRREEGKPKLFYQRAE